MCKCSFAWPGTYGHECWKPADRIAVFKGEHTVSGLYYTGRCAEHAAVKGYENTGVLRFEPVADQMNEWKHFPGKKYPA